MTLPKITPFRAALTIGSSTIAGGILYDRWRCDQIRGELLERARVMGSRPMHDPLQAARHVEVFLSAGDKGEGSAYSTAFDKYVKPVFDGAALDYHLSECWLWHDTVRPRVAVYVNTDTTVKRLREEAKSPAEFWLQYYDDDKGSGGVSVVGMGRAAYKGVVTGLADVVASELQAYTDRVEKKEEEGAAKSQSSLEQDANASDIKVVSSKQRQSWLEWLGWSKTTKAPADTLQVQEPTEMDDTAHADLDPAAIDALHALASDAPLSPLKVPPVGYIPFKPIGFWRRMFFERFAVEQAGRAALIIAEGHLLPMYELFPGGIRFNVDEAERTKVDDAGDSTETTTKKEQAGDDERPLLAIAVKRVDGDDGQATAFEIPELLVEHLLIYHKEEADAGETDDATIVGRREVTTRA